MSIYQLALFIFKFATISAIFLVSMVVAVRNAVCIGKQILCEENKASKILLSKDLPTILFWQTISVTILNLFSAGLQIFLKPSDYSGLGAIVIRCFSLFATNKIWMVLVLIGSILFPCLFKFILGFSVFKDGIATNFAYLIIALVVSGMTMLCSYALPNLFFEVLRAAREYRLSLGVLILVGSYLGCITASFKYKQ